MDPSFSRQSEASPVVHQPCQIRDVRAQKTDEELQRALERLRNGVLRGAIVGFTLRGGLHLLGSALTPLTGRKKQRTVTLRAAVRDTLRYTAFLGSLAGVYIGVDEGIAATLGKRRTAEWRSIVAGICAGQTLLLTGPRERHYSLATYILLRGLTLLVRTGNRSTRRPLLHALLAPTRLEHGDTLLMCLSCCQVIYAFVMMPQTLPTSYVRFIRKQGAKELYVWQAIRELAQRSAAGRSRSPLTSLLGTPHADADTPIPCTFFHPGQDCWGHAAGLLPAAYLRALSVYLPVYLLPALLVHRQQLLKQPSSILGKVVLGTARSSLFLSLLISLAFAGACGAHRLTGRSTGPIIAMGVWVGGLATLLEKKSRRMELALYVLSRALESFSRCLVEWGAVPMALLPARMDVALFAAGVGAITHAYSDGNGRHRSVFKSKYLNVLDFVFGNTGISEGSIKHVPSNQDLLSSVHRRVRSLSSNNLLVVAEGRRSGDTTTATAVATTTTTTTSSSSSGSRLGPGGGASTGGTAAVAAVAAGPGVGGSSSSRSGAAVGVGSQVTAVAGSPSNSSSGGAPSVSGLAASSTAAVTAAAAAAAAAATEAAAAAAAGGRCVCRASDSSSSSGSQEDSSSSSGAVLVERHTSLELSPPAAAAAGGSPSGAGNGAGSSAREVSQQQQQLDRGPAFGGQPGAAAAVELGSSAGSSSADVHRDWVRDFTAARGL